MHLIYTGETHAKAVAKINAYAAHRNLTPLDRAKIQQQIGSKVYKLLEDSYDTDNPIKDPADLIEAIAKTKTRVIYPETHSSITIDKHGEATGYNKADWELLAEINMVADVQTKSSLRVNPARQQNDFSDEAHINEETFNLKTTRNISLICLHGPLFTPETDDAAPPNSLFDLDKKGAKKIYTAKLKERLLPMMKYAASQKGAIVSLPHIGAGAWRPSNKFDDAELKEMFLAAAKEAIKEADPSGNIAEVHLHSQYADIPHQDQVGSTKLTLGNTFEMVKDEYYEGEKGPVIVGYAGDPVGAIGQDLCLSGAKGGTGERLVGMTSMPNIYQGIASPCPENTSAKDRAMNRMKEVYHGGHMTYDPRMEWQPINLDGTDPIKALASESGIIKDDKKGDDNPVNRSWSKRLNQGGDGAKPPHLVPHLTEARLEIKETIEATLVKPLAEMSWPTGKMISDWVDVRDELEIHAKACKARMDNATKRHKNCGDKNNEKSTAIEVYDSAVEYQKLLKLQLQVDALHISPSLQQKVPEELKRAERIATRVKKKYNITFRSKDQIRKLLEQAQERKTKHTKEDWKKKELAEINELASAEIEFEKKLLALKKYCKVEVDPKDLENVIREERISSKERLVNIRKIAHEKAGEDHKVHYKKGLDAAQNDLEALKAQQPPAPTPPEQKNPLPLWKKFVDNTKVQFTYEMKGEHNSKQYSGTVYTKDRTRVESNNGLKGCIRTLIAHNIMSPESCQDITYNKDNTKRMSEVMRLLTEVDNDADATDQEKIEAKRLLAALKKEHTQDEKLDTKKTVKQKPEAKDEEAKHKTDSPRPNYKLNGRPRKANGDELDGPGSAFSKPDVFRVFRGPIHTPTPNPGPTHQ